MTEPRDPGEAERSPVPKARSSDAGEAKRTPVPEAGLSEVAAGEAKRTPVPEARSSEVAAGEAKRTPVPEARTSEVAGAASETRTGPLAQAHGGKTSRAESFAGGLLANSRATLGSLRASRIRLTRTGLRIVVGPRVPWWGRLESRVITALVALGILCVGASAYLVTLTVQYFDGMVRDAARQSDRAVAAAGPLYDAFVRASKQAYRARTQAIARELELGLLRPAGSGAGASPDAAVGRVPGQLAAILQRDADIVELRVEPAGGVAEPVVAERRQALPEDPLTWVWFTAGPESLALDGPAQLTVTFAQSTDIDRRYQDLGALKRGLDYVEVNDAVVDRGELEAAVFRAIGAASALVLMVAFIAGFILARATTRKLSVLSEVILRVAGGDLRARVPDLGQDELGQLGAAFNGMLDELDSAQRKVSYLQRVGAWQEMARRIAHEIKNPLTPIQLAVQQIREKDPGTSAAFTRLLLTSVEIVEDEVEALRRMVTSFSRFARVPEVQLEPVEIARVVGEFDRAYGHLTERDSDVLEVPPVPEGLVILGDRQLLKQCLVNLVENAVLSQRERGPVHVRVSVRPVPPEAGVDPGLAPTAAELRVDDNGPGIEPERRERVFEPYESTRKEGTGLGLAIVKKVVLDHGGEVRVDESELGGAAIVIRLPLHTG
ncbi:ATP-binding protein [Nannocystis sp.]|uniref:sensor histidine kinase n=1 Tax=Nannocystis sp. TaxID=1962667 RepID=UPI0025EE4C19|nr:ATP-binding protein [Nannocystis sp.]MBK7823714.1 HAMP domain-containing protein [Nannocystis sp.]